MNLASEYNLNRFVINIKIKKTVRTVYRSWSTSLIERWFPEKMQYITFGNTIRPRKSLFETNDRFTWTGSKERPFSFSGEILFTNNKDYFRFSFVDDTIVSVLLKAHEDETIVQLVHEGFVQGTEHKLDLQLNWCSNWTFYLANLKSVLEEGVDLRDPISSEQ